MAAVIAAPLVGLGLSSTAATTIATLGLYAATTAASIFLQMAMAEKPEEEIGTKLNAVLGGSVNQSFHIGDKESAGSFLYKGSWGKSGRVPNAYLVKVYCLSDRPVEGFADYMWVDGIKCNYNPNDTTTIDGVGIGHPIPKYDQGGGHRLWVKFHDGNQVNADNYLVAKFGTGPRAWTEDFVGRGRAYMIVTQKYDKKNPSGEVEVLPVIKNSRLYDFRNDSTNGGSGSQRYNDDSTWGVNPGNPVTASYHIMRGLYRGNEWIYGGQKWPATRFDTATWTAAANKCDTDVGAGGGGTVKWSRVGAEIDVSEEPWTIIERMLKSCNGRLVESGGKFKIYVGGIGASVYSFTDDDVILSEELTGRMFPTRDDIANTVVGTYIEPANAGEAKAYKARTKTAYVEEDGDVRKMTFDLDYVRENRQAQRLAQLALNDNRRFRTFVVAFWSQARKLEPCDVISWTSDRFQFTNKKFIVGDVVLRDDGIVIVNLREADAADADWNPLTDENPFETGVFEDLDDPTQTFAATVTAVEINDDNGKKRRPAIRIQAVVDDEFVDCEALRYIVRKKNGDQKVIYRGRSVGFFDPDSPDYADVTFTNNSFMEGRQVQVKYKIDPESDRTTEWSSWIDLTLSDILPDTPTNFALTAISKLGDDGKLDYFAKATWDEVAHDRNGYGLKVTVDGEEDYFKVDGNKKKILVNVPSTVTAKVRTLNVDNGRPGDYTTVLTVNVTKRNTAPTTPTQLDVIGKHRRAVVKTEDHPDPDFKRWNLYFSKTNNFATGTKTQHGRSNRFVLDDLDNNETYYAWITAENTSGAESAKYPASNTNGVEFKTKKIDDDDTGDDALAAPTSLVVAKVQDVDEDGPVKTFLYMTCVAPAWATGKAKFEWEITAGGRTVIKKSGGPSYTWRVHKIGEAHDVRVRAIKGVGANGDWSGIQSITPTKKTNDVPVPTGVTATAKGRGNKITVDDPNLKDLKWVLYYSNSVNNSATSTLIERRKGLNFYDKDPPGTDGDTAYYWTRFVDNSGNLGGFSTVAQCVNRPIDDTDTGDTLLAPPTALTVEKVQEKDEDGTIRTFLKLDCTPPAWAGDKADFIYKITVAGSPKPFRVVADNGTAARFRVNKTGVSHSVIVKARNGVGRLSSWTSPAAVTPLKKTADASAVTGVSSHKKNGDIIVKWNPISDRDNAEYAVRRATSNNYALSSEIGRIKGTRYVDNDAVTKGVTYFYFIDPVDTSGNVGTASASTSQTETGIGTSDTDATLLAAPTGISIFQANRDVDQDGKVDIAMRTTFSGGVANAAGYEVWWEDNAGQSATARADSGSWWFKAVTTRSYRVRWRTINWVGTPGAWSAYTSYVTPSPTTGAPPNPVVLDIFGGGLALYIYISNPAVNDYSHTEVAFGVASDSGVIGEFRYPRGVIYRGVSSGTIYLRNVNTSGLKSGWTNAGSISVLGVDSGDIVANAVNRAELVSGAAGNIAITNSGTSMGSVNPGSGYSRTFLSISFKMTSNTAGVTVNLGGYSTTVDFVSGQYCTITTTETGSGSFNASKSGGNISGCQICAVGIY